MSPTGRGAAGTLLRTMPPEDAAALLRLGTNRVLRPGEVLIREGSEGTEVFVILSGVTRVISNTEDGRLVILAIRVAGEIVGELAVIDRQPRSATVQAAGQVVVRAIPAARFRAYLAERPMVYHRFQVEVTSKLREAIRRQIDLTGGLTVAKVARVLEHLAADHPQPEPEGIRIGVRITHEDLCGITGTSTASLERALQQLRGAGLIVTGQGKGRILVTDTEGLHRVCVTGEPPA